MMNRQTLIAKITKWVLLTLFLLMIGIAGLKLLYPFPYSEQIEHWASTCSIDPYLVAAVIRTESHFRVRATSSAGAIGLMQIMPATGEWIASKIDSPGFTANDLYDPQVNIRFGVWYLRYLLDRFEHIDTALVAYNAGPTNAARWKAKNEHPFPTTITYVTRSKRSWKVYRTLYSLPVLGAVMRLFPV